LNFNLIGATVLLVVLQFVTVYVPFVQHIVRNTTLTCVEWMHIIPVTASIVVVEEVRKWIYRKRGI